ncbi:MAG: lysoplasmalogenase [Hyphomicrobiales bacterium]|nr:lysoplasmalogenase [Hyphomicrobiales bacterium]
MPSSATADLLSIALAAALVYLVARRKPWFPWRPALKGVPMAALALSAMLAPPVAGGGMLVLALSLSMAGDVLLDLPDDRGFLAGLGAFLLAHLVYAGLALPHVAFADPAPFLASLALIAFAAGYYAFLRPHLDGRALPVALYVLAILLMGVTAFFCTLPTILIPLGALLFILSDAVLAFEKFIRPFRGSGEIVWVSYVAGQTALAAGFIYGLGG